jgi:hypothetical protein
MKRGYGRLLVLLIIVLAIAAFFVFDLGSYLTLENLKSARPIWRGLSRSGRFSSSAASS